MPYPIKVCVVCSEEFELRPGKPGFANRCWECSAEDGKTADSPGGSQSADPKLNEARRRAIRDLLYRKE
jgi:hypothetical protein